MKLKEILFLDNDHKERSLEELHYATDPIYHYGGISDEDLNKLELEPSIKIVSEIRKNFQDLLEEISDKRLVVLTWSMYTFTHFNSIGQLEYALNFVGRNEITDLTYIDSSGNIEQALESIFRNTKHPLQILHAIETNNIISIDFDIKDPVKFFRLRVDLKGMYKPLFRREKIDLLKLITE